MAALFDRVAADYDERVPVFATFGRCLVEWIGVPGHARVLDVGAGRGAITAAVVGAPGFAGSVLAADVSAEMVARLHTLALPQVEVRRLDAQALDLADESFDVVLSGFVLHILPDPQVALAEIARVLKPGGRFGLAVPGPSADGGWWAAYGRIVAEFTARAEHASPAGSPDASAPWEVRAEHAGLRHVDRTRVEVSLPISGPAAHWSWLMSHGNRWIYDALDDTDRAEFERRVLRSLDEDHADRGNRLIAGAELHKMSKPQRRSTGSTSR